MPNVPFLIVGQAPDKYAWTQDDVLAGPKGKLLVGMLKDAGFKPEEYIVTNAVKERLQEDRKPTAEEVAAWRPKLLEEIHEHQPIAIITLGDTAFSALGGRGAVSKLRGTEATIGEGDSALRVFPTYNPAYVARVPQVRRTVVSDLIRARRLALGDTAPVIPYRLVDGTGEATEQRSKRVLAYDIETDYWWTGGNTVIQAAVAGDSGRPLDVSRRGADLSGTNCVVYRGDSDGILRSLGADASVAQTLVSHNGWNFDDILTGLRSDYDTMALAYVDDESQPLGLESLAVRYLGVPGWKEERGTVAADSEEFALYNARDAKYTLDLYNVLRESLGERIRIVDEILRPANYALKECSTRGVYISPESVDRANLHYGGLLVSAGRRVAELADIQNPNSTRQVGAALLAEGHYLPPTDTGLPSTSEAVLSALSPTPLVVALKEYRKVAKTMQAFVKPYQKIVATESKRVHPEYTILRTETGRTSARNLNIQQLPRDPMIRSFLSAPPGYELWSVDYSAIEFRIAAWVAQEHGILERYAEDPNWDPHQWFGDRIGMNRQAAKSANFGLLYMAQPPTFQEYARKMGVRLTLSEAADIRREWHHTFPAFGAWYMRVHRELNSLGYVETFTGRRRHFGEPSLLKGWKFAEALREAVNTHVQSPAADIALLGLRACHEAGLPINGFYHDANTFEFREGEGARHVEQITQLMTQYPITVLREKFGIDFNMPLVVEAKKVA